MQLRTIGPRIYRDTGEGGGGSGEGDEGTPVKLKPGQVVIDQKELNRTTAQATERKAALRKVLAAAGLGDDGSIDDVAAKLAKLNELETKQAENAGQYKELLAAEREKVKAAERKAEEIGQAWQKEKLENAVMNAAGSAKAKRPSQIVAIYGGRAKLDNGKLVHAETGADFVEFLAEEAKGENANLFEPPGKPGSGASPGNRTSGVNGHNPTTPAHLQATIEAGKAAGLY